MQLVIVESPAKAKTINQYLGPGYKVMASYGHVRDLPPRDGSVDPARAFAMEWEVSDKRREQMKAIAAEAGRADRVILATDPDREGEAISWHLAEELRRRKVNPPRGIGRVTFNAVTRTAVGEAMARPRAIDQHLVDAYLARRALDYLVGFTLSPVLWRKLPGAKSAGRVQSVALRLVVEREREIEAFVAREYWTVDARLDSGRGLFDARLVKLDGTKLDMFALADAQAAEAARARVAAAAFRVAAVDTKPQKRQPAPPFTTSTLQQEAARKLGMGAQQTMRAAQSLYEAGHITYMRTDGVSMAPEAIEAARAMARELHGPRAVPAEPRRWQTKAKNAQEAHEAIRPTDFGARPGAPALAQDEARLYELIWKRAVASQMAAAELLRTTIELDDGSGALQLRAIGTVVIEPGFLALYVEGEDDADTEDDRRLPSVAVGDEVRLVEARADQHFTRPPPRFTEASLVKRLEELGIGRPSTYASILQVLGERAYVRLEKQRFFAEEKGRLVTAFLERFFGRYVAYDFTADLENRLDDISAGEAAYTQVLEEFWSDFRPLTDKVMERLPSEVTAELDEELAPWLYPPREDGADPRQCPSCAQGRLGLRTGRFGAFVGCSRYPDCRFTRPLGAEGSESAGPRELGLHPETGLPVVLKRGRYGLYVESGEERSSVPAGVEPDLELAVRLLSLPRLIGPHPETGLPIRAGLGRYGPFVEHDGKYANLASWEELFEIGHNRAVELLARPRGRQPRAASEPLRVFERSEGPIRLMAGRYGPYVTDGATNASLPKGADPAALTLAEAEALIAARAGAERKPPRGAGKARAKKPAAANMSGSSKALAASTKAKATKTLAAKSSSAASGRKAGPKAGTGSSAARAGGSGKPALEG